MSRQRMMAIAVILYITFLGGTAYAHTGTVPDVVRLLAIVGPSAVWLVDILRTRRAFPRTALDAPLAVLAAWLVITALLAQDRRISLEMIWPLLAHILAFYLLVDLIRRGWADHLKAALLAVAALLVALSAIELARWYGSWLSVHGLSDPIPPKWSPLTAALNVSTIEGNYVAMLIPLALAGVIVVRRWPVRAALIALCVTLLGVEIMTFSRGGLLGALVATGTLFVFAMLRWQQGSGRMPTLFQPRLVLGSLLIAVLGAGLLFVVWTARASRADSDMGRITTWRSTLDMIVEHPVTGVGPGVFGLALREYRDPATAQDRLMSAHDLPLNILAEMGIPGLLIVGWLLVRFGGQWMQAWQIAGRERQLWLEGGIAALLAYSVHSLVDVFPLTSSVLPLLIVTAYAAADPRPAPRPIRASRRLAWGALATIGVFGFWIITLDVAQGWMALSLRSIDHGNLDAALDQAEKAQAWDPSLSLYDLHNAYVLGLLASEQPDLYLDRAIAAHEATLAAMPTFDLGWANLSALYVQRGDFTAARRAMQQAAAIQPNTALYWLELGDYTRALDEDNDLAAEMPKISLSGLYAFLANETIPADERLYVAVLGDAEREADRLAAEVEQGGWFAELALGLYEHRVVGDDKTAMDHLTRATALHPADERAALERAEIELAHGDYDGAEGDAREALFVDHFGGAPGNFVLARIQARRGAEADEIEAYLLDSIALRPVPQSFASTVYARPAGFRTLPQLGALRISFRAYDGGLALARFYRSHGQIDAAREVYHMMLVENPYLSEAEAALAALPESQLQEVAR
ncbi:O-antigen ligase family protein [Aggregatilinea lenta]|uniref:O-antigen ligase family protein n=1 Tax=Aggregatilinea lenta TaxID=913108 RepID=UPI000E5A69A0|nr:O-antigen ligase family protein [Aggregatilinea lenta]